jgi:hypothetical protein
MRKLSTLKALSPLETNTFSDAKNAPKTLNLPPTPIYLNSFTKSCKFLLIIVRYSTEILKSENISLQREKKETQYQIDNYTEELKFLKYEGHQESINSETF